MWNFFLRYFIDFFKSRLKANSAFKKIFTATSCEKEQECASELAELIQYNFSQWSTAAEGDANKGFVLVEGLLAEYGPNYAMRTGLAAKAIEERTGCAPLIYLGTLYPSAEKIYRSFGFKKFIYAFDDLKSLWHRFQSLCLTIFFTMQESDGEKLLALRWKKILIGDLIYDEILHELKGVHTIDLIKREYYSYISKSFWLCKEYSRIFDKYPVKYFVSTHSMYSTYGLLMRIAKARGILILETTDAQLCYHLPPSKTTEQFEPPYYFEGLRNAVMREYLLLAHVSEKKIIERADEILTARFSGASEQIDVVLAYREKKAYTRHGLAERLGSDISKKNIFIFAHVFNDAPHLSARMLFKDYYAWLHKTLTEAARIPNVNWFLKSHPSDSLYNHGQPLDQQIGIAFEGTTIFLLPADMSTNSIQHTADAVVTCQGTIGLEASCLGIPAILAGQAFYAKFGFTEEPASIDDYFKSLHNCAALLPLTPEQLFAAKKVLVATYAVWDTMLELIPQEVLNYIWGYAEGGRDLPRGYRIFLDRLKSLHLPKTKFYTQLQKIIDDYNG